MYNRGWRLGGLLAALLMLGLAAGTAAADGDYVGTETCEACHEETVAAFALTAHAVAAGWDGDKACESCHGPGSEHADGDEGAIIRPQMLSSREASENCLSCHERNEKQFKSRHATHSLADVSCIDCHNPHSSADNLLEARGTELCAECHQSQVAQFEMPRSHPLPEKGDACESCHNPHTASPMRTMRGSGNATCKSCHFDKAGPFLYEHDVSLVDGCESCHTVHGSTNRHLLTHERQINLCYSCHVATQTPSFHNASNFLNEKCTACHTAIHGSNTNPFFLEE